MQGHVLQGRFKAQGISKNVVANLFRLIVSFFVRPLPFANVRLLFQGQFREGRCEEDGFFRFEWERPIDLAPGVYPVTVTCLDGQGRELSTGQGHVYMWQKARYAFVSDIDDTVLRSYSSTVLRRLYEMLAKSPSQRRLFDETAEHYRLLSRAHAHGGAPNPFFYVSSSEWNLYDYLEGIFRINRLPRGIFLLNQIKRWRQLLATGKKGHEGKLMRIARVLKAFPDQRFVLIGDNTQKDPEIYHAVAIGHPGQVYAVYIRIVNKGRQERTALLMHALEGKGIHVCMFRDSQEAIADGRLIGLIDGD